MADTGEQWLHTHGCPLSLHVSLLRGYTTSQAPVPSHTAGYTQRCPPRLPGMYLGGRHHRDLLEVIQRHGRGPSCPGPDRVEEAGSEHMRRDGSGNAPASSEPPSWIWATLPTVKLDDVIGSAEHVLLVQI